MEIETHDISVIGRRTHYLAAGSGSPLLLHGDGESAGGWRPVLG